MAQITINIPAGAINSLCIRRGYTGNPADNTAKLAFVKNEVIIKDIKDQVREHDLNTARAAVTVSDSDIT
jgi:hypothetical protein